MRAKWFLEHVCSITYRFKVHFDPALNWEKIERKTVQTAKTLIKEDCQERAIRLLYDDEDLDTLIEWRLYQLHRTSRRTSEQRLYISKP